MSITLIFIFFFSGCMSGLLGGLLGIGGGIITVPILFFLFRFTGLLPDQFMQVAISTSLATTFVTAAVSTLLQLRKKAIHFPAIRWMIPGLIIGCIAGSLIVHKLSSPFLRELFGGMAILMGGYYYFPRLPFPRFGSAPNKTLSLFGILIGAFSSLLGIGGGTFTLPILIGYNVPVRNAVATSSGATLATAFIGTIAYLILAWNKPELPETFGYIEIPAFISISIGSIFFTPLGVKLSHTLHTDSIKRVFAICLIATGLFMILL
jgi:uncharacterized membrane protein YfcA